MVEIECSFLSVTYGLPCEYGLSWSDQQWDSSLLDKACDNVCLWFISPIGYSYDWWKRWISVEHIVDRKGLTALFIQLERGFDMTYLCEVCKHIEGMYSLISSRTQHVCIQTENGDDGLANPDLGFFTDRILLEDMDEIMDRSFDDATEKIIKEISRWRN